MTGTDPREEEATEDNPATAVPPFASRAASEPVDLPTAPPVLGPQPVSADPVSADPITGDLSVVASEETTVVDLAHNDAVPSAAPSSAQPAPPPAPVPPLTPPVPAGGWSSPPTGTRPAARLVNTADTADTPGSAAAAEAGVAPAEPGVAPAEPGVAPAEPASAPAPQTMPPPAVNPPTTPAPAPVVQGGAPPAPPAPPAPVTASGPAPVVEGGAPPVGGPAGQTVGEPSRGSVAPVAGAPAASVPVAKTIPTGGSPAPQPPIPPGPAGTASPGPTLWAGGAVPTAGVQTAGPVTPAAPAAAQAPVVGTAASAAAPVGVVATAATTTAGRTGQVTSRPPKRRRRLWVLVLLGLLLLLLGAALLANGLWPESDGADQGGGSQPSPTTTAADATVGGTTADAAVTPLAAEQNAAAVLGQAGLDDVSVSVADSTATLSGFVGSDAERAQAIELVAAVDGIESVDDQLFTDQPADEEGGIDAAADADLAAAVDSALSDAGVGEVVTASVEGGVVTLTGQISQAATRADAITAASSVEGIVEVDDQLQGFEAGSLDGYLAEASGVAGVSGELDADGVLVLSGVIADEEARAAVLLAAEGADGVDSIDDQLEVVPSDDELAVAAEESLGDVGAEDVFVSVTNGVAAVTGRVESEDERAAVLAAIGETDGLASVEDQLTVRPSDEALQAAVATVLENDGHAGVTVSVVDGVVSLAGEIQDEPTRAAIVDAASGVDGVVSVDDQLSIEPGDPAALQASLDDLLAVEQVTFDFNSRFLDDNGRAVLDQVAERLIAEPGLAVEIGGHTDNVGGENINRVFSTRRAEAVLDHLVSQGVAADRLTAVGYGPSQPVASNATVAGRDQNRRIEFTVATDG